MNFKPALLFLIENYADQNEVLVYFKNEFHYHPTQTLDYLKKIGISFPPREPEITENRKAQLQELSMDIWW